LDGYHQDDKCDVCDLLHVIDDEEDMADMEAAEQAHDNTEAEAAYAEWRKGVPHDC
jgi:hypothetical protein